MNFIFPSFSLFKIAHLFKYILFAFLLNLLSMQLIAQDTLHFSTLRESIHMDIGFEILKKAYAELGYIIILTKMSGPEALKSSNEGKFDGELLRIDGITNQYSNLVQVPIPVTFFQGGVFSTKYYFPIDSWYSLESYKIGIVDGAIYAERGTANMNVIKAKDAPHLFEMLLNQKIDVAVTSKLVGQLYINDIPEMRGMEGILETLFLYHYVHKKNTQLVPDLEKILKRMLLDGTSRRMKVQMLRSYNLRRNRNGVNR